MKANSVNVRLGRVSLLVVFVGAAVFAAAQSSSDSLIAMRKTVTRYALDSTEVPAAVKAAPSPLPNGGVVFAEDAGVRWLGTNTGLARIDTDGAVAFFASPRYLPDNDVRAVVGDGAGGVWVRTATGIVHIDGRPISLAQKADELERTQLARHDRYGFAVDAELASPGDLAHSRTVPSDNDGLWTAMYAAGECFRYGASRSPEALARAQRALDAVLFLTTISGIPGYPARSYVHAGEPVDGDVDRWYDTPDKRFKWKGDTSSDEIVGHYFLYAAAYDLLPDDGRRQRVVAAVRAITDHILSHGYYLVGEKGKPTTWGRWSLDYLNTPDGREDGPLNAIELLSLLKVAAHVTGDPRYDREYRKAVELGYAELGTRYLELRRGAINYSDEELFMLAIYPLMSYEKDVRLLGVYQRALDAWWQNERREQNPLWSVLYERTTQGNKPDVSGSFRRLATFPLDRVEWTIANSGRADVTLTGAVDREGCREAAQLLPLDELPIRRWNANPFCVDGGNDGRSEAESTTFLLPYWMARFFGMLPAD